MAVLYSNNATTTLAAGITNVATSLTVATGTGALFPAITGSDFFYATLIDSSNNIEIVKVTARASDTFTIVRAQEGTTARAYVTGDKVELRVTAAGLANKLDKDTGGTVSGPVTLSGTVTLGSTTFNLASGTTTFGTGTANFSVGLQSGGVAVATLSGTQTLTNKSVSLASNTVTGTLAQFNTACTDADFVSLAGTETLTNKTLTSPVLNTINGGSTVGDTGTLAANSVGFRGLPPNSQSTAYTLALTDMGKIITTTSGVTIPANASVAFPVGTAISIFNTTTSSITVSITTDALYLAGNSTPGSRTISGYGLATLVKVNSTSWVISGAGVS